VHHQPGDPHAEDTLVDRRELLNLGVLGRMDRPVTHVGKCPQVLFGHLRGDERSRSLKSVP